ncbi:MAG: DUF2312 domain-containing protein [Methylocystaceae bacterium]|nr:DUF2312 domain-containing protein [Methylocystaceae bacterium]
MRKAPDNTPILVNQIKQYYSKVNFVKYPVASGSLLFNKIHFFLISTISQLIIHFLQGGLGFDVKIMRQLVRLRKMEDHDRTEQEEVLDLYKRALGME